MSVIEAMEWIKLLLTGILVVEIPVMYLLNKNEIAKKAKEEAEEKVKAEYDRQKKLEFYESTTRLNNLEIEEKKRKRSN
ncbi:MAG: hypothetical protein E6344_18385 [Clostridium sp.]|nr:hypothetical protein [Clostridium sp.]MDU7085667.1 hypothetical protein [Clostridium sp.]